MSKIVKIERLVASGTVNANGIKYDEESLKKSLEQFQDDDASVRINQFSVDEINDLISSGRLSSGKFDIVGQLINITDTHIEVKLLVDIPEDELSKYKANIHAMASDIKPEGDYELAIISKIDRIIIGIY